MSTLKQRKMSKKKTPVSTTKEELISGQKSKGQTVMENKKLATNCGFVTPEDSEHQTTAPSSKQHSMSVITENQLASHSSNQVENCVDNNRLLRKRCPNPKFPNYQDDQNDLEEYYPEFGKRSKKPVKNKR